MNSFEKELLGLVTEADVQRGCKDVAVELRNGKVVTLRLSAIAPNKLVTLCKTLDERKILRAMLPKEFATDSFLDSIEPHSFGKLGMTAMGLAVGPQKLLKAHQKGRDYLRQKGLSG